LTYRTGERRAIPRLSMLVEARAHLEAINAPAAPKQLAVALERLCRWAEGFKIPHDPAVVSNGYAAIAHLPADLLTQAIAAVTATHRHGVRLPLPAEILQHVQADLDERRQARFKLDQLQRAARIGLVTEKKPTRYRDLPPDQKAEADRIIAETRRALGLKPFEKEDADDGKPNNPPAP